MVKKTPEKPIPFVVSLSNYEWDQRLAVRPEPVQNIVEGLVNGPNAAPSIKPVLIFGYGNLSRGDDALGPALLQYVRDNFDLEKIELLDDFQLQVEHALDLCGRELILFVDAAVTYDGAFGFTELTPAKDSSYTTHAMSPAAVLSVYQDLNKHTPPPCFLLSIKGEKFELGEGLTVNARNNLEQACRFTRQLLSKPDLNAWRKLANDAAVIPARMEII